MAQDPDAISMTDSLIGHVHSGAIVLLTARIVVDEFERNRGKIIDRRAMGMKTWINHARSASSLLDTPDTARMQALADLAEKKIPTKVGELAGALNRVNDLLTHKTTIQLSPEQDHAQRVVERALSKKAPFHRSKNSVADALLMECFRDFISDRRFVGTAVFATENSSDYCDEKDKKTIHADYSSVFDGKSICFSINVAEIIRGLGPFKNSASIVARYAQTATLKYEKCPAGEDHSFDESRGAYLRSQYGGLTWQLHCSKCGARFDTGDHWD